MIINPRKLFAIVGYPQAGKRKTAREIFQRKRFFPYKQPIKTAYFGMEQFIIISSHYYVAETYLHRIKTLIELHAASNTSFIITLNLLFDNSRRSIEKILAYFSQSGFEMHYLVLSSGWREKKVISKADMAHFEQQVINGTVHLLDRVVTQSELRFNERTEEVKETILRVLETNRKNW